MISYIPFYETLYKQGRTEYEPIYHQGISSNTLYRMKQGKPITTSTLDTLCLVLHCGVSDVICYAEDDSPEAMMLQQRAQYLYKGKNKINFIEAGRRKK